MNIGPILRGALGKSQPAESKTLELRTGQVVKGTVLSVSDDGAEAVVEVQGVKLKAALETPLQQGQTMMMQVQPPGQDGLTVLKPLPAGSAAGLDQNVEQLLKNAGLEDNSNNRELVRLMQQAGLPVTKEQTQSLVKTLTAKPSEVPLQEWVNAAAVAVQRGLPISAEIVRGLQQAIFGPPVHQLLGDLEQQLALLLNPDASDVSGEKPAQSAQNVQLQGSTETNKGAAAGTAANAAPAAKSETAGTAATGGGAAGGSAQGAGLANGSANAAAPPGLNALLQKLQSVLGELRSELAAGRGSSPADAWGTSAGAAAGSDTAAEEGAAPNGAARSDAQPASNGAATSPGPSHGTESWVARVLKLLGAEHEQQAGRALLQQQAATKPAAGETPPGNAPSLRSADGGQGAGGPEGTPADPGSRGAETARGAAQTPGAAVGQPPAPDSASSASRLPNSHHLHTPAGEPVAAAAGQAAIAAAGQEAGDVSGAETNALALKDSLKSILLQIVDTPDAPPQLQEAAKQMIQQLTGQQLLLNTDRTAPFAQVTMFLPFRGPDGEETATVQIQSRRGKKGELDPDNCRLWFDLNMSALGKLMVDVQVADKKVILNIHSEGNAAGVFLEGRQDEISSAIESAGYRLLSMRTDSYITDLKSEEHQVSLSGAVSYAPPAYKGVDYRV